MKAGVLLIAFVAINTQDALQTRVMTTVRQALSPALPFPESDALGSMPATNDTEAVWMVKPLQPGDTSIEILSNPLNEVNQLRGARAMRQIETNIESAQRRAQAQYDHALAEAKRTGKSQEVDGVTLNDEGVAGAKIDAEQHVIVDVAFNQSRYKYEIASAAPPQPSTAAAIPGAVVIGVTSSVYRDNRLEIDRYGEAQTLVFLGALAPQVNRRADHLFEVTAAATAAPAGAVTSVVLRLTGNDVLLADILRKTNWPLLLELLK